MTETDLVIGIERRLIEQYGPILGGKNLSNVLGFPSIAAFRQALWRKRIPVPVFSLPQRRGKFALSRDVAVWLAEQRQRATREN